MRREFTRNQRLGNQVLRTLNELLRFETKDPRLQGVTLSAVDLSRDLSVAQVYFSTLNPNADPVPVQKGLENASGFLRAKLALVRRHGIVHRVGEQQVGLTGLDAQFEDFLPDLPCIDRTQHFAGFW